MRAYKATIFHAGKQNHQITKENLSAAEIVILKNVHGAHAVVDIYDTGKEKMFSYIAHDQDGKEQFLSRPATINDEKEFLSDRYSANVFATVFPGAVPVLPTDLEQVGIEFVKAGQISSIDPAFSQKEEATVEVKSEEEPEKKSKLPKFLGGN